MTFFERIANDLSQEPFFKDFKYRKRDSTFIQRFEGGWRSVDFRHITEGRLCSIYPGFKVRFDIALKWFEKFSVRTLTDQRDSGTVGFEGVMLGYPSSFDIPTDGLDYDELYADLRDTVIKCATYTFNTYKSIQDVYYNIVIPQVKGDKEMPSAGAEWVFRQLIISKIIDPEHFSDVLDVYLKHAAWMISRNEPNMASYYYRMDEIISYMESLDLDKMMQSHGKKVILRDPEK